MRKICECVTGTFYILFSGVRFLKKSTLTLYLRVYIYLNINLGCVTQLAYILYIPMHIIFDLVTNRGLVVWMFANCYVGWTGMRCQIFVKGAD
jgi:hypothetical protein